MKGVVQTVRRRVSASRDSGSIALYLAIFATAMIAMAGLVIDGGAALATRQKAADVADQAARAGANALSPVSLRDGDPGDLRADPIAAKNAADAVLSDAGATGEVTVNGAVVTVTAHIAKRSSVLSAVGVDDISQSATQSATSIHGTTTAGN
ncbi:MAG: pilus assembly protein TadG-related protein [Actinomycetota bacterium]|nr:pilus assembly protein TadG-related protein [Actinomycetota bacterium]MDQ2957647.1 pilus assembly protein TadG-related protein [Actinomycetota bacterium]